MPTRENSHPADLPVSPRDSAAPVPRPVVAVRPAPPSPTAGARPVPAARHVVGAAIVDNLAAPRRVLSARRAQGRAAGGGWEFPGGKIEAGESAREALLREVREELGCDVTLGDSLGCYPIGRHGWTIEVFLAVLAGGPAVMGADHDEIRWLTRAQVYDVEWLPADLPIVDELAARMRD